MSRKSEFNLSWLVLIPMADRNSNTIGEQPTCHSRTECARLVAQNGNPVHCYWHVAPGSPRSRLLQKCKFKDIVCSCHSERSEESPVLSGGSFGRFATQDDMQNTDFEFCNTLVREDDKLLKSMTNKLNTSLKCWIFFVALLISLFLISCEQNNRKPSAFTPAEETIAFVNNKKITLATFNTRLQSFLEKYRKFIISDDKRLAEIKDIVINMLIDEELINQEAARKGIQVPEREILAILNGAVEPNEGINLDELVKNYKLDEKEWKNQVRLFLLKRKLIEQEVLEKTPVTKREIESYYQGHRADFTVPQGYQVRNITLATEEEANAILSQIKRGRSFRRLIRLHSISPDKNADGDLGFIEKGTLPLEMESAIFRLGFRNKKSRVSEVIRSQDGFHIFQLIKYRRRRRLNLNQARPKVKQILVEQKIHDSYQTWLNRLKDTTTISIDRAMLAKEEGF